MSRADEVDRPMSRRGTVSFRPDRQQKSLELPWGPGPFWNEPALVSMVVTVGQVPAPRSVSRIENFDAVQDSNR